MTEQKHDLRMACKTSCGGVGSFWRISLQSKLEEHVLETIDLEYKQTLWRSKEYRRKQLDRCVLTLLVFLCPSQQPILPVVPFSVLLLINSSMDALVLFEMGGMRPGIEHSIDDMHRPIPRYYISDGNALVIHEQFSDVNVLLVTRDWDMVLVLFNMNIQRVIGQKSRQGHIGREDGFAKELVVTRTHFAR
jgi:hypothetical protein